MCDICCEESPSKLVPCDACKINVCVDCISTFLFDSKTSREPQCMKCKALWDYEFIVKRFGRSFNKRCLTHMTKMVFEEERVKFPITQGYAKYDRFMEDVIKPYKENLFRVTDHLREILHYENRRNVCAHLRCTIDDNQNRIRHLTIRIQRWKDTYDMNHDKSCISNAPVVVSKCPVEKCEGFVTDNWKCGVCDTAVCKRCNMIKMDSHKCNESDVESFRVIRKDSKPCPKCATLIHKISGCDQMWCTLCKTTFSWETGEIQTNVMVHNPHFFEWFRKHGRADGEIHVNCNGLPPQTVFLLHVRTALRDRYTKQMLYAMYRLVAHVYQHEMTHKYRVPEPQVVSNVDIHIKYLNQEMSKTRFERCLMKRKKRAKVLERQRQIFDTFVKVASDIFHKILHCNDSKVCDDEMIPEFMELLKYVNGEFVALGKVYEMHMPQLEFFTAYCTNLTERSQEDFVDFKTKDNGTLITVPHKKTLVG